ncbi:MAG TPA: hypothetical protein VFA93_02520, partial [Patescibacteria group bacterium]|nr:hypothetical protein [Patescibacteria group bacterium]
TGGTGADSIAIGTSANSWFVTAAGALTVASCTGCGGGGGTLQQAYDSASGNTISTSTGKNITFTNATGLAAPTTFSIVNNGTADAMLITNNTTATNGLLISQPTTSTTLTNGINVTQSGSGAITNGLTFTGTFTNLISSTNFTVSNAGAISAATSTNTINSLIINAGALSGITGYTQGSGTFSLTSAATSGNVVALSDTSLSTTGNYIALTGAVTGLTTGALIDLTAGATYNNTTTQDGSAFDLTVTDASAAGAGVSTSTRGIHINLNASSTAASATLERATGLSIDEVINTSGAAAKDINGVNVNAPTLTGCASGTCNFDAVQANLATNTNSLITQNGLTVTPTGTSTAGTINGININNITAGAATETAINIGTGWDTGIAGAGALSITAATTNTLSLDTTGAGTVSIAPTNAATVNLGSGAAVATINMGTGAAAKSINLGQTGAATTVDTINIGMQTGTVATTINLGSNSRTSKVVLFGTSTSMPTMNTNGQIAIGMLANATLSGRIWIRANGANFRFNSATTNADYSEYLVQDDTSEPGDVMVMSDSKYETVHRGSSKYDQRVLGVVTQYGTSGNQPFCEDEISCARAGDPKYANVGMLGQVYTKVSTENGIIHPNDPLTTSSVKGVAMKATKMGRIIGYALDSFDGTQSGQDIMGMPTYPIHQDMATRDDGTQFSVSVGKIVIFLQAGWYDPSAPPPDIGDVAIKPASGSAQTSSPGSGGPSPSLYGIVNDVTGKDITAQLVKSDAVIANLSAGATITKEMFADSLNVSGTAKFGNIDLSSITPSGGTVTIQVGKQNGQFVIQSDVGNTLFSVDSLGNAYLKGELTADKIHANQIEGLNVLADNLIANKLSSLAEYESTLTSTQSAQASPSAVLGSKISFDNGNVNILADLSVNQTANFNMDLNVLGKLSANGALVVVGPSEFKSNTLFDAIAEFFGNVIFHNDVLFNGRPTFNSDTAGFAVVQKGADSVDIAFDKEYANTPLVNASITLDQNSDPSVQQTLEKQILDENIGFIVTRVTTKGFTIKLNRAPNEDIKFSWSALAIKDAKTSTGVSTPAPSLTPSPTPSSSPAPVSSSSASPAP